jgi:DNA polymerase III subunit delta
VILKSYIVEQKIETLNNYRATLIYGENNGVKSDIKEKIKHENKESEIITFFESDILRSNLLYENVINQSLFSEKKIIFIQEASDKIFDKIKESLEEENIDIKIYLFSGNLEKKTKIRSYFEKGKEVAIFACYEDNERTLITYIHSELKGFKGVTGEIVNLIIRNSDMDRRVIKNELDKIKIFFKDKQIDKKYILDILNIKKDSGFNEIRDRALMGEKMTLNKLLSETDILNEEVFFYLNNLNYRVLRLKEIVKLSEGNNKKYDQILETIKPPIFWKDKPVILQQLKKWNQEKLEKILAKISETEILMKKNSYIRNDIVIKDLIINLTRTASSSF